LRLWHLSTLAEEIQMDTGGQCAQPILLALIEPETVFRETLTHWLAERPGIRIASSCGTLAQGRAEIAALPPDVVLLETQMPDGSGIDLAREIKDQTPATKVVFLSRCMDEGTMLSAISAGADGFISKQSACDFVVQTLQQVLAGQVVFATSQSASLIRRLAYALDKQKAMQCVLPLHKLSEREREIAEMVAQGLTNHEIAERLYVSVNTVKTHLRKIFHLLVISSRRDLMMADGRAYPGGAPPDVPYNRPSPAP